LQHFQKPSSNDMFSSEFLAAWHGLTPSLYGTEKPEEQMSLPLKDKPLLAQLEIIISPLTPDGKAFSETRKNIVKEELEQQRRDSVRMSSHQGSTSTSSAGRTSIRISSVPNQSPRQTMSTFSINNGSGVFNPVVTNTSNNIGNNSTTSATRMSTASPVPTPIISQSTQQSLPSTALPGVPGGNSANSSRKSSVMGKINEPPLPSEKSTQPETSSSSSLSKDKSKRQGGIIVSLNLDDQTLQTIANSSTAQPGPPPPSTKGGETPTNTGSN